MKWFCRFCSGLEGNSSWDTRLWASKKDHSTLCFLLIIVWSAFVLLLWVGPFFTCHFGVNCLTSSSLYSFGSRVSADRDPECIPYDQQLPIRTGAGRASHVTMPFSEAPDITHASLRWEDKLNLRFSTFFFLLIFINIILKQYLLSIFFIAVSMHLKTRTFWYFCRNFWSIFKLLLLLFNLFQAHTSQFSSSFTHACIHFSRALNL